MARCRVLILDFSQAFSTLLRQEIEDLENTTADVMLSGREVPRATAADYALTVVDMDLPDCPHPTGARLTPGAPGSPAYGHPAGGQRDSGGTGRCAHLGYPSQAIFLPELPECIQRALSRSLAAQVEADEVPARAPAEEAVPNVIPLMSRLA